MLRMPYDVTGKPGRQGNDEAEPEDLPNLVRRCAMVRATASCDGQDGRLFSCENAAAPPRDGFFVGVQRMYVYGMEEQQ